VKGAPRSRSERREESVPEPQPWARQTGVVPVLHDAADAAASQQVGVTSWRIVGWLLRSQQVSSARADHIVACRQPQTLPFQPVGLRRELPACRAVMQAFVASLRVGCVVVTGKSDRLARHGRTAALRLAPSAMLAALSNTFNRPRQAHRL